MIYFYEKEFKKDYEKYVEQLTEILFKLEQIFNEQKTKISKMINLISTLLKNKMKQKLTETYQLYINKILQFFVNIQIFIPKEDYTGNALKNINLINTTFNLIISKINQYKELLLNESHQIHLMILNDNKLSFELTQFIKEKEDSMSQLIIHVKK